ncbi:hypothetical protein MLD38_027326 [Melastoma candidum]|uniref:Uncharacterized protein n=1 Tax=Melastoma candidum TaxID=119954 RepID=A0ACB9P4F1_9MYRT|nr:hypothetical protein MLD38_027326 [Melastoma candidum]
MPSPRSPHLPLLLKALPSSPSAPPLPSLVPFTRLISTALCSGLPFLSLSLFSSMLSLSILPNHFALPLAFKSSASLDLPSSAKLLHCLSVKLGLIRDVFVGSAAFDVYSKLDLFGDASKLFDEIPHRNAVTWNSFICNAVSRGKAWDALEAFLEFRAADGDVDRITLCAVLNACALAEAGYDRVGRQVHGYIVRSGWERDVSVGNGLVDFYGKCGDVRGMEMVFEDIRKGWRNDVSWGSLMSGYVQNHMEEKACTLFLMAMEGGVRITEYLVSLVISACAELSGSIMGSCVHGISVKLGMEGNVFVSSSLVDLYGKCGSIDDAVRAFQQASQKNLVTYNSLISGYARQGCADEAIELLEDMVSVCTNAQPNYITFVSVLSACSRAGKVELGISVFQSMRSRYRIEPGPEHYACVVDLLGRAGFVERAFQFIQRMPIHPTISIWGALLDACRKHGYLDLGKLAAKNLYKLDPKDSGGLVVLSNAYAARGRWEEASRARDEMKSMGIKKGTGYSWITIKGAIHIFQAKDTSHVQNPKIQEMLSKLKREMEEAGYIADPDYALYNLEEEEKLTEVWHHSEKIALAFGLLSVPHGVPIRIAKNMRICGDCHSAFKFITKLTGRDIIMRDNARFHLFKGGVCNCGDFW